MSTVTIQEPVDASVMETDWWSQMQPEDLAYVTGPRHYPEPCPWCGGRYRHNPVCVALDWEPRLTFGKHKGKRVSETPVDYLAWLKANSNSLNGELRAAIDDALRRIGR
jgi:hypothetical protein